MPIDVKTGVGRIVWGNPAKAQVKKDLNTKLPILKDGQPVNQWAFGVAFPKAEFGPIWAAMSQEAATGFPNGTPAKFAWKYVDGDAIDGNGVPFSKREGYAGCYVLTISSEAFAPPIYRFNASTRQYDQLKPEEIKTGDYVAAALNIKLNIPDQKTFTPSLYINPQGIEFVGYGQEIQNGPDPMALFGGQQRQLPPGASATPLAPAHGVGMPGTNGGGGMPNGPAMQPGGNNGAYNPGQMQQPNPGQMQQPNPGQMQQPNPGQMQQPGYQQPAPGYSPPNDPRFTGGGNGQNTMPNGPGMVQPAHDFVQNAGYQQPGQPGGNYNPNGGGMPGGPGQMQQHPNPGQQMQQPGMMPPNR